MVPSKEVLGGVMRTVNRSPGKMSRVSAENGVGTGRPSDIQHVALRDGGNMRRVRVYAIEPRRNAS